VAYDSSSDIPVGQTALPFLKWAGGKRWLFRRYRHLFPARIARLVDPFLGGGSSFFCLNPKGALLGDLNSDLVITYNAVKNDPEGVNGFLKWHQANHSDEYYYSTRRARPASTETELAAWLIYLNRTCWNGLYRVNLKGEFNVPRGTKNKVIVDNGELETASILLGRAEIVAQDFEQVIDQAGENDVVFADPPYFEQPRSIRFVKYDRNVFGWKDQLRLKEALLRATQRGAECFVSNANSAMLIDLYESHGELLKISRAMVVAASSHARREDGEILVQLKRR
jgi:DNA adenine methylase